MPIFPGNAGDIRVGFGLWEFKWASVAVEAAILLVGAFLYWRATTDTERAAEAGARRADIVTALIVASGAVVLALDVGTG